MAEKKERKGAKRVILRGVYVPKEAVESAEAQYGPDGPDYVEVWVPVKSATGGKKEVILSQKEELGPGRYKAPAAESWRDGTELRPPPQTSLEAVPLEGADGG